MCIYIMMYVCVYICIYTYIYIYIKQDRNEITVTTHLPLVNKCLFVSFHVSRYFHLALFGEPSTKLESGRLEPLERLSRRS